MAPRAIPYLMGLSGLTYLVQGWVAGSEGFSQTHPLLMVLAWALSATWMIWPAVVGWRWKLLGRRKGRSAGPRRS